MERLIRVVAPHFVAACIIVDGVVTESAPILGWSIGWNADKLSTYFTRKGWTAAEILSK